MALFAYINIYETSVYFKVKEYTSFWHFYPVVSHVYPFGTALILMHMQKVNQNVILILMCMLRVHQKWME